MDDTINRRSAIDSISCDIVVTGRRNAEIVTSTIGMFVDRLMALPPAQPERKKGKWIAYDWNTYSCSCCGKRIITNPDYIKEHKFCFGCGADLRGEQDE